MSSSLRPVAEFLSSGRGRTTISCVRATVASIRPHLSPNLRLGANPSPFDIFHFKRDQPLTPKEIKARYLQLVKIYHPDRQPRPDPSASTGKGKAPARDPDYEFKQIVAAHELLSNPARRETYLRSGYGWAGRGGSAAGGGGAGPASPWSQSTAEYHFRRGRPMTHGRRPASVYDHWTWSSTWSDPHNPHFRPEDGGGAAAGMAPNDAAAGWQGEGVFGKNGAIFLALALVTFLVTPLSAWYAVPTVPAGVDPFLPGSEGKLLSEMTPEELQASGAAGSAWMPRVYDKRHQDAAANLQRARLEAKVNGHEKREALKRRVEQMRREQAFERAQEVQAIERQQSGTGHLALPPPSS
ncbi:hypothetical protein Rhopal_003215-T1 [Rhodotorula paludigena]|uniref:J domain-containing protein n=1 Tax=Rhodotorula paludigena TaxID=86838 RepID=A0AAV5GCK3_9BASI|nr:hypothetical protein Rhopal_003215-T1 [Rhodotorula paludigena]